MPCWLLLLLTLAGGVANAQTTPVPLASQPNFTYTEDFSAIAGWSNGFTTGTGANRFAPVAVNTTGTIPGATRITTASSAFVSGTSGGVQKGTGAIVLLSTGATDNTSSTAIDFLVDFTGLKAGRLSLDVAAVANSTGNRAGTLKVYGSTDGSNFVDLSLNFTAINNLSSLTTLSGVLPAAFDNVATARFRLYYYNGGANSEANISGSRPKISIDNLTVTGTQLLTDPTLAVNPNTLSGFSTTQGTPSAPQPYTVTASNLVAPIMVTAPASYEISLSAQTGYATSLTLPTSTTSTTLYARLTGATIGQASGTISHTSNNTLTASVSVSGQVNDPNTPTLSATPTTLSGFAAVQGNASGSQTFSIMANNLSGQAITVVAPAGFELTTGATYSASLTVTPASNASTIPVMIRTTASAASGPVGGNVTITGGSLSATVAVSGTITASSTITRISSIQGSGSTFNSAFGGSQTIEGIVTRTFPGTTWLNGFYVQEEDADSDGNPATSEGIFIYDPAGLFTGNAGDKVRVTGTVAEFTTASGGNSSSLTQLTNLTSVVNLGASTFPAAASVQFPVTNVSDLERYEGMLVTATAATGNLTVTEYFQLGRFGQIVLSANGATNNPGTDARLDQYTQFNTPSVSGYSTYLAELAKRRIILDDGSSTQNPDPIIFGRGGNPLSASNTLRGGDEVTSVTAVLDERLEGYRLQTTTGINFLPTNARSATPPDVGGTLKVGGFNLLNYFNGNGQGGGFPTSRGADTQAEFTRQRTKTIQAIVQSGVDVFALNELENDGYGSTSAIQDLINGVNGVAGPGSFTFINPGTSISTDEITVAMIYKPSKVTPVGAAATLTNSSAFNTVGRLPLAQTFRENATGGVFTVVANHFKSKGSSSGGAGDSDAGDGQGQSNGTRTRQAQDLAVWLATNPTGTTDPDVLVLGDLNAYAQENPLAALANGGFTNLLPNTSYSYVFDGQVGSLDHALGSASLRTQVSGAEKWHINSDEPSVLDYNVEFKTSNQITSLYSPDQFRTSDHDPVIVGLSLVSPTTPLALTLTANPATLLTTQTTTLSAVVTGGTTPYSYTFTGPGTITPNGNTAQVSGLSAGVQSFTVLVRDATSPTSQTAQATVSVQVSAPNQAPVAPTVSSQTATVGQLFSYTVPAFTDPENQMLTYTATINPTNGLVFNAATRVISGQPTMTGVSNVTVIATDPGNLSASATFTITVNPAPNTAPTVANAIPPQSATVGQAFSYVIPANTFADAETPNALTLTVTGLPAGLSFTAPATISGTPSTTLGSPISVTVAATDPGNLSVTTTFSLSITAAPAGLIRITEYMYNGTPGEYVELTNVGNAPVDMTGWSYDDNTRAAGSFSLGGFGIVQPGESVVFTEASATSFRTAWYLPTSVKVIGGSDQNLGRSDEVNIYNATGTLVDRLTYNDQGIAGSVRTSDVSGWTERANLGQNLAASYKLSVVGDVQNSYLATTGNLGNPGGYFTPLNRVLVVESANSTTVAEGGATDTYTVALNSRPSANVTVTINAGSQLTTTPMVLTFTPTSFGTAQTVTVTAVDDNLVEGTHTAQLTHSTASADAAYNGIVTNPVNVTITDNDNPATAVPTIQVAASTTPFLSLSATGMGYVSGVISDPTDPAATLGINFTLADTDTPVSSLTVTASSSNPAVASTLTLTGTDAARNLKITPAGVGYSTITVTVSDGANRASYVVNYATSAASVTPASTRFHTGTSDASTAILIDASTMLVADDENQVLRLYNRQNSGLPIAGFDFTSSLGLTDLSGGVPREVDLEASTRLGNRIFWLGSASNADGGAARPNRNRLFATDVAGTGAGTTLSYVGRYDYLRNDILAWDAANGHGKGANYYGLVASAAAGVGSKQPTGFNIEGVELAPDNATAYVALRAPQVPTANRTRALVISVTNFTTLPAANGGTQGQATFGPPIEFDLGGRGIREIRKNSSNEYIIIAGPAGDAGAAPNDFRLYTWTGNATDAPVNRVADLTALAANGSFESIVDVPVGLGSGSQIQLLVDNGDAVYYNDGVIAKELPRNNFKKFRSDIVSLGAPVNTAPTVANAVSPQSATVGQVYTLSLAGVFTDAQTPNQLTLAVSGLPAGLSFVAPATISGTPSVSGVSTITLTATDPGNLSANSSFVLTVNPAPVVVAPLALTLTATPGTLLTTGSTTLSAVVSGGTMPYSYTFTGPGRITPNGNTATATNLPAGVQSFTVRVADAGNPANFVSATVSVTVSEAVRLLVLHRDVDNYADNNAIQPLLQLVNQGAAAVPLSAITLRYYLTVEGAAALSNLSINYAQLGNQNVRLRYIPLTPAQQGAGGYVEYSFTGEAGDLAPGANSGSIQAYFAKSDYSALNELDDYSYATVRDQLVGNPHITAYYNGVLVAGVEPGSSTQVQALRALTESKNGPSATQINTYLSVRNEGNVPVNYSELKARYYFTSDGNDRLQVEVDEGNVRAQLVRLPQAVAGANYYLEISYLQNGQLAPGAMADRVRYRISKPDGGRFDQTNDFSYQEQPAESSSNGRVPVYVGSERVWGTEPGGSARLAASEPTAQLEVTVLGNPIRGDVVAVQINGAGLEPLQLKLVTAQGQVVAQQHVVNPQEPQQLSLAGQPAGTFLLQVSSPTQSRTVRLLKVD